MSKLTAKQLRFIEVYEGNGVIAAKLAGYKGNDRTLSAVASENLSKPNIAEAIKSREKVKINSLIATREQRQIFWTKIFNDVQVEIRWRLQASELLGKSQADFTSKVQVGFSEGLAERLAKARKRRNG